MKKILSDILKTIDPEKESGSRYSLSRISLLVSTIIALLLFTIPFIIDINIETYDIMTDGIIIMLFLFAGYAFGGKVISASSQTKKILEEIRAHKQK